MDDTPKTGIYSEVEDPYCFKAQEDVHFDEDYTLPKLPPIALKNPTEVLQESMEEVRKDRTIYRARHIPLDQLYEATELEDLSREFEVACTGEEQVISLASLQAKLLDMKFSLTEQELIDRLRMLAEDFNPQEISFEMFARLLAIVIEEGVFGLD